MVYTSLVTINAVMCARFVFYTFKELSEILDIDIFSIEKQVKRHKEEVEQKELDKKN